MLVREEVVLEGISKEKTPRPERDND